MRNTRGCRGCPSFRQFFAPKFVEVVGAGSDVSKIFLTAFVATRGTNLYKKSTFVLRQNDSKRNTIDTRTRTTHPYPQI